MSTDTLPPTFKARTPKANQKLVAAWKHPEGTPVVVHLDTGARFETVTRSLPWMLGENSSGKGGHTAVILVEGISGCYALERVKPIP